MVRGPKIAMTLYGSWEGSLYPECALLCAGVALKGKGIACAFLLSLRG